MAAIGVQRVGSGSARRSVQPSWTGLLKTAIPSISTSKRARKLSLRAPLLNLREPNRFREATPLSAIECFIAVRKTAKSFDNPHVRSGIARPLIVAELLNPRMCQGLIFAILAMLEWQV
jgi:hypothetical protein